MNHSQHMGSPSRFLGSVNSSVGTAEPPIAPVDSDFVVVLAALLCALICIVGLTAVARCAWLRRCTNRAEAQTTLSPPPKGLKKRVIRALPKFVFNGAVNRKLAECPICLTEFVNGEEVRVLPQCGHGFHVACIDMWLGSHSSCPSCRQVLVVARCQKCGGFSSSLDPVDLEAGPKREDDPDTFLP